MPQPKAQDPLPHDLDAERSLLCAMIINPRALEAVIGSVTATDFYRPAHADVHEAIFALATRGDPVDTLTLAVELKARGAYERIEGDRLIADILIDADGITSHAESYARIVTDHAHRRRMAHAGNEIRLLAVDTSVTVTSLLDQAEHTLFTAADTSRGEARHAESLEQGLSDWLDRLEDRYSNGEPNVTSGLFDLDAMLTGFRPGQLITVAGRPGMGKSLLGTQIAVHAAKEHNKPVLFVSVEMSAAELHDRIISSQAAVDLQHVRTGKLLESDWPKLSIAVGNAAGYPLHILDHPTATLAVIRSEARRVAASAGPLGLIVVDYLQLLTASGSKENRQVEVSELSSGLKRLARDLEVPVIALAQLNRGLENRADKHPTLADLRESGAIENDSDVVIAVYRDEYYNPDSVDRGTAELVVLKQRNGPTGTVHVAYLAAWGQFRNMLRVV